MDPWDYLPAYTKQRLIILADFLRRSRDSAAKDAKRKLGDSLCAIGLVAYDRSRRAITRAAVKQYSEWLSTAPDDNHFVIKIGGVPSRFYRGDADMPIPTRTLRIGPMERLQTELALQPTGLAETVQCVRWEVEKDERGYTRGVNFVLVGHDNERLLTWPIPRFDSGEGQTETRKGGVRLPPLSLGGATQANPDKRTA